MNTNDDLNIHYRPEDATYRPNILTNKNHYGYLGWMRTYWTKTEADNNQQKPL